MYKFCSNIPKDELETAYKSLYSEINFSSAWRDLIMAHPVLKGVLGRGMTAEGLLTAPFEKIAEVYFRFIRKETDVTKKEWRVMKDDIKAIYDYDSNMDIIANFFNDAAHGYEIYNCVYCDLKKASVFKTRDERNVRQYQTEHVLDKGTCPLLGLSLYNFVPSCPTCNGRAIKGNKTIGENLIEVKRLSPTVENYDFENNVHFIISPLTKDATFKNMAKSQDDYEVDFDIIDKVYCKSVDLFELKSRYNTDHKGELLQWADERNDNTEQRIKDMADVMGITPEDMYERIFHLKASHDEHRLMDKARRDIVTYTKG